MNPSSHDQMLETALGIAAAALVLTAILGIVWHSRARAARRFSAAMEAYAEREIDRERRWNELHRVRGISSGRVRRRVDQPTDGERPAKAEKRFTRGRPPASRAGGGPFR
jgi:hypothetical protein